MTRWTQEMLDKKLKEGKIMGYVGKSVKAPAKTAKYKNKRCEWDGKKFPSEWERDKYIELCQLERAGHIRDLKCQVPFGLNPSGTFSYKYIADFCYYGFKDKYCVVDTKGYLTREYKKKRALMLKVHGISVIELKKYRK